jgi:acyl carrier protein
MELDDFVKNFANLFEDTDASAISADTVYQDLDEWGSLITMSIVAMVRTKYNKAITGKEIHSCETIAELFDLVAAK